MEYLSDSDGQQEGTRGKASSGALPASTETGREEHSGNLMAGGTTRVWRIYYPGCDVNARHPSSSRMHLTDGS